MNCLSKTFQGKIVKFAATTKNSEVKFYNTDKLPFKIIIINFKMSISLSFHAYPYKTQNQKTLPSFPLKYITLINIIPSWPKYIPIIHHKLIVLYHYDYISPYLFVAILSMRKSGQKKLIWIINVLCILWSDREVNYMSSAEPAQKNLPVKFTPPKMEYGVFSVGVFQWMMVFLWNLDLQLSSGTTKSN